MSARDEPLTVTVTLRIPFREVSINSVEEAGRKAAHKTMAAVTRAAQERYQAENRDLLERREWRGRRITTCFGEVDLPMLKVRNRETGRSRLLGVDVLAMTPGQRATESVIRRAVELRVRGLSYRQAAGVLTDFGMGGRSAMWIWRRVQEKGRECRAAEEARREAVAAAPETPLTSPPPTLFLEADEIHVKAQRSAGRSHRVKVGLSYVGRRRVPGLRHRRYELEGKHLFGGIGDFETFGDAWRSELEWRRAVSHAPAVMFLSDGDGGLLALRARSFPHAVGQIDWAHVMRDIGAAAPDERRRRRWTAQFASGRTDLLLRSLKRHRGHAQGNQALRDRLIGLIETHPGLLYGWKRFRRAHDPQRRLRLPRASGGIEKNQEITIARAMKRRGMAWSAEGAHNLVKLLLAYQDKQDWNSLWSEPSPPVS